MFNKINLYAIKLTCNCGHGCISEMYVYKEIDEALKKINDFHENLKVIKLQDCEDLKDERYIYKNRIIKLEFNDFTVEGDEIILKRRGV